MRFTLLLSDGQRVPCMSTPLRQRRGGEVVMVVDDTIPHSVAQAVGAEPLRSIIVDCPPVAELTKGSLVSFHYLSKAGQSGIVDGGWAELVTESPC